MVIIIKKINLREARKQYPDMPECCQRCQLFLHGAYRQHRPHRDDEPTGRIVYLNSDSVVQCGFPDDMRNKTGDIPLQYIKYCSEFVREDTDQASVIVTDGNDARNCASYLGLDTRMDVVHLKYKSGEDNPYAENRIRWIKENKLISPKVIDMQSMWECIDYAKDAGGITIGLDFEWNPDNITQPHTIGIAWGDRCSYSPLDSFQRQWLKTFVKNDLNTIVGHDLARAEIQRLFDMGIHDIKCKFEDSMVTTWELMDRAGGVALKDLCYKHLPIENYWYDIDDYSTYNNKLGTYCAKDAWASLYYLKELKQQYQEEYDGMSKAHDLDMRMLLPTAYAMWKGIGVDMENVRRRTEDCRGKLHEYGQLFRKQYGGINPAAPEQVKDYMNTTWGLKVNSTAEKLLVAMRESVPHPAQVFIDTVLEYRGYEKTLGMLQGDLLNVDTHGNIHTYMKVAYANTGRPSYSQPNIAQIPKELRDIICSTHSAGELVTYDRGQSEYRCVAYLSNHKDLINAFQNGVDIHTYAADAVGIPRTPCKNLNFAYLYYANDDMLRALLRAGGIRERELNDKLKLFKDCMDDLREWQDWYIHNCISNLGFAPSPYGRRGYRLRPTAVVNYPVQSWSADLNKETLLYFFDRMRGEGLQSHIWCEFYDGTEIDVAPNELPEIQRIASGVFTELPDVLNYNIHLPFPLEETLHGHWWGG